MTTEVKICGINSRETLAAALAMGADYIGLVFYPPSPRNVSLELANGLAEEARGRARIVALAVDASDELLAGIAQEVRPDYLQAHGEETPARVREIAARVRAPVIKAVKVGGAGDVDAAASYAGVAEMLLFDAPPPRSVANPLPGGNGVPFDWSLLGRKANRARYMLSGGLDPGNVADAIRLTGAPIVDVSSGVERAPGVKDPALIRKFIEAVRSLGL